MPPAATTTDAARRPRIGVLAMQGAFAEHVRALEEVGAAGIEVRTLTELDSVEGIVLPGGESTAIRKALDRCGLLEPLRERIAAGLPALGTCAGLIVLADEPEGAPRAGAPACYGLLDVTVVRNGFGRQVHSFEGAVELDATDGSTRAAHGVFIRAPRVVRVGPAATVVGRIAEGEFEGEPVVVRQGDVLGATFHPELTGERALHELLLEAVVERHRSAHAGAAARG